MAFIKFTSSAVDHHPVYVNSAQVVAIQPQLEGTLIITTVPKDKGGAVRIGVEEDIETVAAALNAYG